MADGFGVIRERRMVDRVVPAPDSPIDDYVASSRVSRRHAGGQGQPPGRSIHARRLGIRPKTGSAS